VHAGAEVDSKLLEGVWLQMLEEWKKRRKYLPDNVKKKSRKDVSEPIPLYVSLVKIAPACSGTSEDAPLKLDSDLSFRFAMTRPA
jgi:hypothetical protein